jgi:CRP/FNR family transcriptional regulator, cyclic AMP receptor protein
VKSSLERKRDTIRKELQIDLLSARLPSNTPIQSSDESGPATDCLKEALGSFPVLEYPASVNLFHEGIRAESVYFIASGIVKLSCLDAEGTEVIVGLQRAGWILGATAVILKSPHLTSATTLMKCGLVRMSAAEFRNLLKSDAQVSLNLHDLHAREVRSRLRDLMEISSRSTEYRLRRLLSEVLSDLQSFEPTKDKNIRLPLKRWEISQLLAVTPEYTSRLLHRLELQGLIRRNAKFLEIPEPGKLFSSLEAL